MIGLSSIVRRVGGWTFELFFLLVTEGERYSLRLCGGSVAPVERSRKEYRSLGDVYFLVLVVGYSGNDVGDCFGFDVCSNTSVE